MIIINYFDFFIVFKTKVVTNPVNKTSTTDELSKWKPAITKSRLSSSNKTTIWVLF
jgi:hypothetical protein